MSYQNLSIYLEPKTIAACSQLPIEIEFMGQALQHQLDVFEGAKNHDIILDLSPTGTGKTQAGLGVILHNTDKSAVYIAPTNALIEQQTKAAEEFIKKAGLPHVVKAASAKDIKAWPDDKVGTRSGEKLYNVLREPTTIFPECGANRPILLVTNPDIFYYATFFAYNHLDRGNIASVFYSKFATIIFDEFHLYDAKQLVGLLFYIALSHVFGFFKHGRKVVLLTATPEPACETALRTLEAHGVRIKYIDGEADSTNLLPSQTAVNLEIRPQLSKEEFIAEIADEVEQRLRKFPEQNGAVILDAKDTINRLADALEAKGFKSDFGRIIGPTPLAQRQVAVQKQVILATSTVDVGFNFEKIPAPSRQNLDWLIFSARDRFSFWQRIGRVGRVLGKRETQIPSSAIAYISEKAWEQGISNLDCSGGRTTLKIMLENLNCLHRPFLEVYWRSEAFLEIARPLLELEESLEKLPQESLVVELYETLRNIFGGRREWNNYRARMKALKGAENIAKASLNEIQKKWQYIKGGQACVKTFVKAYFPDDWEAINTGQATIEQIEKMFQENEELAQELKLFSTIFTASYAPLFQFRNSLFESIKIIDSKGLLLDEGGETILDPIHLLRFYEFEQQGDLIEVIDRAKITYNLVFNLRFPESYDTFRSTQINKLNAFENCRIERRVDGALKPTPLLKALEKQLIPGVIIPTKANQWVIIRLNQQGITSYPIHISCLDLPKPKEYNFFPSLDGIMAIALNGIHLKCPDDEDFYIV